MDSVPCHWVNVNLLNIYKIKIYLFFLLVLPLFRCYTESDERSVKRCCRKNRLESIDKIMINNRLRVLMADSPHYRLAGAASSDHWSVEALLEY